MNIFLQSIFLVQTFPITPLFIISPTFWHPSSFERIFLHPTPYAHFSPLNKMGEKTVLTSPQENF